MKLSAIICGYNQGRYARQAITSVLAQIPPSSEVLFIDNNSTDDTPAVVGSFGLTVQYHRRPNLGPSAARNFGLAQATGDFVHFLDADDWIEPGFFAVAAAVLAKAPAADVLVGGEHVLGHGGETIHRRPAPSDLSDASGYLFSHSPWPIHAAVVRRQAALSVKGFTEAMWQCEDWDFWLRLAGAGFRFVSFPGEQAVYRQLPGSNSADYFKVLAAIRQTLEANLSRHPDGERYAATAAACLKTMRRALWESRIRPQLLGLLHQRRPGRALRVAYAAWRADSQSGTQAVRLLVTSKRLVLAGIFSRPTPDPACDRKAGTPCASRHAAPPS